MERSAKLFDEGTSRSQIAKAPTIIGFAVPQNRASMPQLNVSRFVELYDLTVQRNIQSGGRDRDLDEIRVVLSLVNSLPAPMIRWCAAVFM